MSYIMNIVTPFIVIGIIVIMVIYWAGKFDYQCEYCGAIFSLPTLQTLAAPHWMMKKQVTCPNCGKLTWATRIPKVK